MPGYYYVNDYILDHYFKEDVANIIRMENKIDPIKCAGVVKGLTVRECAESLELKNFDYSLPLFWTDDVRKKTGQIACGHFVWSYENSKGMGEPVPISAKGVTILEMYNYLQGLPEEKLAEREAQAILLKEYKKAFRTIKAIISDCVE